VILVFVSRACLEGLDNTCRDIGFAIVQTY